MLSKKKREERAKLVEEARALLNAVPEGQAIPAETNAKFDELMARADALKAEIDRIERLEDQEAALGTRIERRAGRDNVSEDEAQAAMRAEADAFNTWVRRGMNALTDPQREIAQRRIGEIQNAQGTVSGPAGGYTVPEGFYGQIISAELAFGGMLGVSTIIDTTSGNPLPIPTENDTSNEGAIIGESVQVSAQDVTFGAVTLNAHTYSSKLILVANQLLQDSAFSLDAFLSRKIGERLARIQNRHATVGDGASKPQGVVAGATLGVTAASATDITFDELIDLEHSVDPAYRMAARYMMADTTLKVLKKKKDGEGRPLWMPGYAVREPDTINGKPYTINQHVAAIAASAKPVLFGDFSKYMIRRVTGVQVMRLVERYADYNQTGFLAFQRWDGALVDAGTHPVKYLANAA